MDSAPNMATPGASGVFCPRWIRISECRKASQRHVGDLGLGGLRDIGTYRGGHIEPDS